MSSINDDQFELNKEELSSKIVKKWLTLQKTIKEEITLEDVIISQQKNDFNNLMGYFKEYYTAKLKIRKTFNDIRKIRENDYLDFKDLNIEDNIDNVLLQACEPIKNLLFLFRNDYNYITKLVSLIDDLDEEEQVESLVQLFCNQFYDNILIPNPEQEELLLLIYKLLVEEIAPMNCALIDDFLNDSSFLGKFCSTYMNREEFELYLSVLINPLISSIENENNECLDMSLISISEYLKKKYKFRKSIFELENNTPEEINYEIMLFNEIPKTQIIFKKNTELEDEDINQKEKKNNLIDNKNEIKENTIIENQNEIKYNEEYKEELTLEKLNNIISHEKDNDLKDFYSYQLEQINTETDIFSNKGLIEVLNDQCFEENRKLLVKKYKSNFLFIQQKIDFLLQSMIDKISTFPYTVRCICKIIFLLISKKFPLLPKFLKNSFVGKFIFEKCIFPVLNLENKNITEAKIFSNSTKNCLNEIVTILYNANKSMLFNSNNDTEKTIFNYYLIEIIPILNKFYDKLIDVKLPKVLDDLVSEEKLELSEYMNEKLFSFKHKHGLQELNKDQSKENIINSENENNINKNDEQYYYNYFKENSDEILHLQCICFSIPDILFIMSLINKNISIFSNLEKYNFFCKTVERIQADEYKLDAEMNKDPKLIKFFVIFKDEKNSQLEKLIVQKNKIESTFEGGNEESELICKRVKFCIKTILKGLNLLNNKDFTYLNMATTSNKFLTALKLILEDLGELSEKKNQIPLKWYGQYISNNKNLINSSYQENDFELLYDEIYNEELNILNELKLFSSIIITRDGMNLRCAEKILEKIKYALKHIIEAKKFLKIEKFVDKEEIEVCVTTKEIEESEKGKNKGSKNKKSKEEKNNNQTGPEIIINDGLKCEHKNKMLEASSNNNSNNSKPSNEEDKNDNKKIQNHYYFIKDFINIFSPSYSLKDKEKIKNFCQLVREDIRSGDRKYQIYASFDKYMDIIKDKIKYSKKSPELFPNISDEELEEISQKIEDHILRKIYKYVYVDKPNESDIIFYEKTLYLDWISPEQLEISKVFVNQLGYAELCIKKMTDAKSVFDKINCIRDAHTNMNNTIKFSSGKNDDAGQDELTPIFQYLVIKAQPKRIFSDINYIKTFLGESSLRGEEGFLVTQMESATSFISSIDHKTLRMSKEEYDEKVNEAKKRHGLKY